jgi:hypothetical protein
MSRYPRCPHDEIPLDVWCVTCGTWRAVGLLLALLAGCGTLPDAARLVPPADVAAQHEHWVAVPQPACDPLPPLYVYEATPAERAALCHRSPPPAACLAQVTTSPMQRVDLAVVSPDFPAGWKHEAFHAFEACTLGGYDFAHQGPQWSRESRRAAGIP